MNLVQDQIQENIRLRSEYRKMRHHLWNSLINDEDELRKCNLIKHRILDLESNTLKKFYRCFDDWDPERLKSEADCILNNKLTFVTPSRFNDPYDCRPPEKLMQEFISKIKSDPIHKFKCNKIVRSILKEMSEECKRVGKNLPTINKKSLKRMADHVIIGENNKRLEDPSRYCADRLDSIRRGIPIVCFANRADDMYFWSHYGGTHKGFCIEYEFSNDVFDEYLHPVEYTEEWSRDFNKITGGANISMILIKSMDWVKELEWRIAMEYNEKCDQEIVIEKYPNGLKISAIYLGLDFFKSKCERSRNIIMQTFEGKKIFQMSLDNNKYRMQSTEYTKIPAL